MVRRKDGARSIARLDLAEAPLASSETARHMNRDLVLELIRTRQPVSRAELSRVSGLQRSTISLIIEQLIRERWVREGEAVRLPRGRRPTMLGLNPDLALLVADIHPGEATLAVVDLYGNLHTRNRLTLPGAPQPAMEQVARELARMRAAHPALTFEGVGISLPGRVDPQAQELVFAPNLHWTGFPIRQTLQDALGLPVELENGANAALLAELWLNKLEGVRDAVLVTIDEGVGTGLLANGQLVTGNGGMAGEFGHIPLATEGPRCGCGRIACWEAFASTEAALRYWAEAGDGQNAQKKTPTFAELLTQAEGGDRRACTAVEKQARAIGRGLRILSSGLAPEVIVVTGSITAAWPLYREAVQQELAPLEPARTPRLTVTEDCDVTRLHGAAAIVLQRNSLFRTHS